MSVAIGLALVLFTVSLWIRRKRRIRNSFSTRSGRLVQPPKRAVMPNASEVLVYINDNGSARELSESEKKYVDTEFSPLDGARPYIKTRYEQRNGWGNLSGFLQRKDVPVGMAHQSRAVGNRVAANTANCGGLNIRTDPET